MAKIFRPRRGLKATMVSNATVLAKGEMFFEVPTTGVGTGTCKVKMGDGSTAYSSLPYALSFDDSAVNFTESTTSTDSGLLAEIVSGASQATLFGSIKALLSSLVEQVTSLNNETINITWKTGINAKQETSYTTIKQHLVYQASNFNGYAAYVMNTSQYTDISTYTGYSSNLLIMYRSDGSGYLQGIAINVLGYLYSFSVLNTSTFYCRAATNS